MDEWLLKLIFEKSGPRSADQLEFERAIEQEIQKRQEEGEATDDLLIEYAKRFLELHGYVVTKEEPYSGPERRKEGG